MRRRDLLCLFVYVCAGAVLMPAQKLETPTGKLPVVLMNGLQLPTNLGDILRYGICPVSQSVPRSKNTFGELENVLKAEGREVLFFDNCAHCAGKSIEECGLSLGKFLGEVKREDGTAGVEEVDLVAHSMGGLIARSYLAGMQTDGTFAPPEPHKVRKLVMMGTPNFGSFWAVGIPALTPQVVEMAPGSDFVFRLATWNKGRDDVRGVDVLSLVGNACPFGTLEAASDGVVSLMSASANFAAEPLKTRVLPYRHTDLGALCAGKTPIANVDGPAHLSAQAVASFLADTETWKVIGQAADEDFYLLRYGAGVASYPGATRLISGAGVEWVRSAEPNPLNLFYAQFLPSEATDLWFEVGNGVWLRYDAVIPTGTTLSTPVKD